MAVIWQKIEELYGIRKEDIVSFSANVNPLGISPKMRSALIEHIDVITSYPDREYTALRSRIGEYTGAPTRNILVGNGSTELISLFIQMEHPKKALILGPTYSEYEREISLGGGTSLYYPLKEENDFILDVEDFKRHLNEALDLLVICNPNNPTSTSVTQKDMRRILDECKRHDIFVIVDETYVEFAPDMDAIDSVPLTRYYNNLVILRGVSKIFCQPRPPPWLCHYRKYGSSEGYQCPQGSLDRGQPGRRSRRADVHRCGIHLKNPGAHLRRAHPDLSGAFLLGQPEGLQACGKLYPGPDRKRGHHCR